MVYFSSFSAVSLVWDMLFRQNGISKTALERGEADLNVITSLLRRGISGPVQSRSSCSVADWGAHADAS